MIMENAYYKKISEISLSENGAPKKKNLQKILMNISVSEYPVKILVGDKKYIAFIFLFPGLLNMLQPWSIYDCTNH